MLHRPVWEGMRSSLSDIFTEGHPADKVIQRQLKGNRKWGSQDRRLFAEAVYDIVRWWRRLLVASERTWESPDAFETAIETWCLLNEVELGKNVPRSLSGSSVESLWKDQSHSRAVRESIPDWMDEWGARELGERWDQVLPALNSSAPVFLRANRLKATAKEVVQRLNAEKIDCELAGEDAVRLKKRANVFLTKSFHSGLFEVQDLNSQKVSPQLQALPGDRVIDACAGGGGKSLHLAALMANKGKIVAMDIFEKKLEQVRERGKRAGTSIIETRWIENNKVIKRLSESANRLLLDVPCSGMGVLRRNPDAKWKLSPQDIVRLNETQSDILKQYVSMCKPGGTIVYATCSIMPSENTAQVHKFLAENKGSYSLEKEETLFPETNGPDGFYFARIKKSD
jgi:16S rRNA (cytosine967-C5)-methyltransferase